MWNDDIPIDKDIRKCIGTMLNYRRMENHLNHPSLNFIKKASKDNLIDWAISSKWFNHNPYNDTTNIIHSKNMKWKIRCSTLSLPTMDIMHQNYPLLLQTIKLCFFCKEAPETNSHIWVCPTLYPTIQTMFRHLGSQLMTNLTEHAEKHSLTIMDSIKYSKTFRWAYLIPLKEIFGKSEIWLGKPYEQL
ncbi:hypothetical protein C1646_761191 [Rhizophagus diaphanus]|nr:hypothetical protein C1646_761191 [Rhizophagus diaphanus] [Rhizophagus sp. MUCL 43196]